MLRGLHSAMITLLPSFAARQGGLWAEYLWVTRLNLSYLGTYTLLSRSTTTVDLIFAFLTTPSITAPLTDSLPWNGHLGSSHTSDGGSISSPMSRASDASLAVLAFAISSTPWIIMRGSLRPAVIFTLGSCLGGDPTPS